MQDVVGQVKERMANEARLDEQKKPPVDPLAGRRGHKLLDRETLNRLPPLYSQENVKDPVVQAKFFSPYGDATWYATEYDPQEKMFFGYVSMHGDGELGYFSFDDLANAQRRGLPLVERDRYFEPAPLSEVKKLRKSVTPRNIVQQFLAKFENTWWKDVPRNRKGRFQGYGGMDVTPEEAANMRRMDEERYKEIQAERRKENEKLAADKKSPGIKYEGLSGETETRLRSERMGKQYGFWLSPSGELYPVPMYGHSRVADGIIGKQGLRTGANRNKDEYGVLFGNGWLRLVSRNYGSKDASKYDVEQSSYRAGKIEPTQEQQKSLEWLKSLPTVGKVDYKAADNAKDAPAKPEKPGPVNLSEIGRAHV